MIMAGQIVLCCMAAAQAISKMWEQEQFQSWHICYRLLVTVWVGYRHALCCMILFCHVVQQDRPCCVCYAAG
jgi:hypothetical protein